MKPRRSVLTVPGHIEKMHTKAAQSKADVILLDLEDSVPLAAKDKARDLVIDSLFNQEWNDKSVTVRINSLETAFGYQDLLAVTENAGQKLDSVVVPKVDAGARPPQSSPTKQVQHSHQTAAVSIARKSAGPAPLPRTTAIQTPP